MNKVITILLCIAVTGMIGIYETKESDEEENTITFGEELERNRIVMDKWDKKSQFVVKEEVETIMYKNTESNCIVQKEEVNSELLQFSQLSNEDIYYLEKIATCEAGNVDTYTMSLVMLVVLNRVKDQRFPNTVYDVIMQPNQFSVCNSGGSWYYTEPNEKSEEAFNIVWDSLYDYSCGALYFEALPNDEVASNSWFGTLDYLYKSGGMRFYK